MSGDDCHKECVVELTEEMGLCIKLPNVCVSKLLNTTLYNMYDELRQQNLKLKVENSIKINYIKDLEDKIKQLNNEIQYLYDFNDEQKELLLKLKGSYTEFK